MRAHLLILSNTRPSSRTDRTRPSPRRKWLSVSTTCSTGATRRARIVRNWIRSPGVLHRQLGAGADEKDVPAGASTR